MGVRSLPVSVTAVSEHMSFGVVSVTAETDCSLTLTLSVTAVSGKTTFGQSLIHCILN